MPLSRNEGLRPPCTTAGTRPRNVAEHPKPTLHHICYVVDDLAGTLARLQRDGVELVDQAPRRGAEGMVAFIHPRASGGVLIELIDRASLRGSIP